MNLITRIRKSYITRGVAFMLALNMLFELIWPGTAMALTSGPSQPEVQSFEPVETTDMVNLFTGDFTYNIPLIYLPGPNGGYPINLAYHGGVTMDEEASWVGLGWNINAGALVRNVRGFADDADGDTLISKADMKSSVTAGIGTSGNIEIFGGDPQLADALETIGYEFETVSLNLGIRYNNYRGFGVTVGASYSPGNFKDDADWSLGLSLDSEAGVGANFNVSLPGESSKEIRRGMGLSYGQEGLGLSFSRNKTVRRNTRFETEKGATSKTGTELGLSSSQERVNSNGSSGLGFSSNTYMPVVSYPMSNEHVSLSMKTGLGLFGVFTNLSFSGYFDTQHIESGSRGVDTYKRVYGYENMEGNINHLGNNGPEPLENTITDFTRQKDGQISKQTPNLPSPVLTCDLYNVVGQGMSGFFRPFRTDVGRVFDPVMTTNSFGGSLAFDLGSTHLGFGGTVTYGWNKIGPWDYHNEWNHFWFEEQKDTTVGSYRYADQERYYYRMHGDKSTFDTDELNFIGGENPILTDYEKSKALDIEKLNILYVNSGIENTRQKANRVSRNVLIHKYTNADLDAAFPSDISKIRDQSSLSSISDISEMSIFYYDWGTEENIWVPSGSTKALPGNLLNRTTRGTGANEGRVIGHHNGGFKVLNDQGQYYVYALPAYNNLEVESIFSISGDGSAAPTKPVATSGSEVDYKVSGTDKFIDKKTKSPYAHSYMLTSILGADYVDVDGNGPSDNDLGYWVRFDYVKYADDYQWRAPYHGANYDRNSTAHTDDDKGSYAYGEKEQWYLAKAETKTHVLVFTLSERNDMLEAAGEFANSGKGTRSGLKIDKISLYTKDEYKGGGASAIALQEVHFEYDYFLCPDVPNNDDGLQADDSATQNQGGKLTLKKIWFTYEGSGKGTTTPYQFVYDNDKNFAYNQFAYDRWGGYKQDGTTTDDNNFRNRYLPYVKQFDQSLTDEQFQAQKDSLAGAWGLSQVKLPSGGTIDVTYEADDYAYVQNETATQMFKMVAVNDSTPYTHIYQYDYDGGSAEFLSPTTRRVYFELENPLPVGQSTGYYAQEIYDSYVRDLIVDEFGNRNLYFKNYVNLRDDIWDYVSGYAPIEEGVNYQTNYLGTDYYLFGIDPYVSSGGNYTRGFITLQKQIKKIEHNESTGEFSFVYHTKYHPMAMAAWQHMRINDPLLLTAPAGIDLDAAADGSDQNKADVASGMLGFVPQIIQTFTGIWKYCRNNQFGRIFDPEHSVIRLCTPDKKKYGGGHRVKQVSISDNWDAFSGEAESTYGIQYEYTTLDDATHEVISSGVAQYEPMHGGDEIALRYPKAYVNNVPFHADNNSFFEHPVNESYFPAPVVGYSKVTIKSLNTGEQMRYPGDAPNTTGIGTTGVTVYEFYTAKDYPVIVEETEIKKAHYNVPIPIPFVGKYERKKITAVQGYKIELNDMHGQVKSIKKYGLTRTGFLNADETSSVEYVYSDKNFLYEKNKNYTQSVKRLQNNVDAIDNSLGIPKVETRTIGVEYEFFTDQRQHKSNTAVAGAHTNVDLLPPFFPAPSVWPALSSSKTNMKTFVTNKIIFKSGILKEVRTFDGKARVSTENKVFDAQTGRPLIVSVNNEFEDRIYNFSHPAHWEYDRMGGAYKNIDLTFTGDFVTDGSLPDQYIVETASQVISKLVAGDELLVKGTNDAFVATYLGPASSTQAIVHVEHVAATKVDNYLGINTDLCEFRVIRSGRRNHVYADAGTIVSMQSPVKKGSYVPAFDSSSVNISETIGAESFSFSNFKIYSLDNVLNSTAVLFRDEWSQSDSVISNPFATGEAGIWRPYRSYVYVGDRSAGTSATDRDLRTAGVMDSVQFFNWQVPDFERYAENWEWTTEISRYNSDAYEVENVDRLGIKSAALYCAKGSQVLAVGANGGYHEIGVEDFEDYSSTSPLASHSMESEGNLNFFNSASASNAGPVIRSYRIERGKSLTGGAFILEIKTNDVINFSHQAKLAVQTNAFPQMSSTNKSFGQSFHIPCTVTDTTYNGDMLLVELESDIVFSSTHYTFLDAGQLVSGRVSFVLDTDRNPAPQGTFNTTKISFTDARAHTGKMSMRLDTGTYIFPQSKLDLEDKTYVLSAWVSSENARRLFIGPSELKMMVYDGTDWVVSFIAGTFTRGKVVEGWQKIEHEFIGSDRIYGIMISNTTDNGEDIFIDDIRIAPKTGGMVSYVYDNHNLRLKAMLDNNNYATLYFYDEQGNLHLVKRETERGIQTISENRGHNRNTDLP